MTKPLIIDTITLAALTAGGTDFIRTKDGVVKGIAIRRDLNPEAPEIVLVGTGPIRQSRARLYVDSGLSVPAYVKRDIDVWEYIGDFRAISYSEEQSAIAAHTTSKRNPNSVAGVLILEPTSTLKVAATGGGFPDSKTRKEIEGAAIRFVWQHLERLGFVVEDRQPENRGYDLYATRENEVLLVEVKGTDLAAPRFYISRNEWSVGRREADWRLFVVINARSNPQLHTYTASEVENSFSMEPLAWECNARDA